MIFVTACAKVRPISVRLLAIWWNKSYRVGRLCFLAAMAGMSYRKSILCSGFDYAGPAYSFDLPSASEAL